MHITDDIRYVGVNDHDIDLFEGLYPVPDGVSYNSYVIVDEKIAVLDPVDQHFGDEWIANVREALKGRQPDYLVVHHMEPDHSANLARFMDEFPGTVVVASDKAFTMMKAYFGKDYADNRRIVRDGDKLVLGTHTLAFIAAPMVHWPEVMMTYESAEKVLFSADGFGKFGALDIEEEWASEARRYYFGIVGKYGLQVQNVLKKAAALDILMICPLHGPVLTENLGCYLNLYDIWSSYRAEEEGVCICYSSVYGHTKEAVKLLAKLLTEAGVKVACYDLARDDMAEAMAAAFCFDRLVLASITYNGDVFPHMKTFLAGLSERGYRNRKVALLENGSWAPMANKVMQNTLQSFKNITLAEHSVTMRSALNDETAAQIKALAEELTAK